MDGCVGNDAGEGIVAGVAEAAFPAGNGVESMGGVDGEVGSGRVGLCGGGYMWQEKVPWFSLH